MDQKKIGSFLKELRKEKNLTQEQAAEKLGVSSRTISRWETGTYMPDISILVEIAEMFGVDVREIIDGERMKEDMNSEFKQVAEKMADYSVMEKRNMLKWIRFMSISIMIVSVCIIAVNVIQTFGLQKYGLLPTGRFMVRAFLSANSVLAYVLLAFSAVITLYAGGKFAFIEQSRMASTAIKIVVIIAILLALAAVIESILVAGVIYKGPMP